MRELLKNAFDANTFRQTGHRVIELLAGQLEKSHDIANLHTISSTSPDEQLEYWRSDFISANITSPDDLFL